MEIPEITKKQYSTVNNNLNYSTVEATTVLDSLPDLVHRGYEPFYAKKLEVMGYSRFMELAQKARAASDTPQRLFSWMLKHPELIK